MNHFNRRSGLCTISINVSRVKVDAGTNSRISMCKLFATGPHLYHWSICGTKIVNNYAPTIIDEGKNDPSKNAVEENDPPKKAVEVHLHGISLLLF